MGVSQKARRVVEEHGLFGTALLCAGLPLFPLLRSELGTRLRRAYHGWTFDRRFGVDTAGLIERPTPSFGGCVAEDGRPYDGSNPKHFNRLLRGLNLQHQDFSFVDFGSGKGRVLLLAEAFPFRSVTGVEWSADLHETAARNVDVYRGPRACSDVRSCCMDAADFHIPQGKCLLYFFNPFKDEIMARVLENVTRSFEADPRDIIIVYVNPKSRAILDRLQFIRAVTDRGWFVVYRTVVPSSSAFHPNSAGAGELTVVPPAA
jgi:SAM-dependent methyltransferase